MEQIIFLKLKKTSTIVKNKIKIRKIHMARHFLHIMYTKELCYVALLLKNVNKYQCEVIAMVQQWRRFSIGRQNIMCLLIHSLWLLFRLSMLSTWLLTAKARLYHITNGIYGKNSLSNASVCWLFWLPLLY